jgi:alkaline phosphatase
MKKSSSLLLSIILIAALVSWSPSKESEISEIPEIKNIILMIGDGMGLTGLYAAMTASDHPLNIERCHIIGLQKTFAADNYITDSGASGTAMATGNKAKNGTIGLDSQGNRVKSILEIAKENGLSTGLVTTSAITDVTPASFIAHESNREGYELIARDFVKSGIDVFIGGGYNNFAVRKDNLDLIDSLKVRGYKVETSVKSVLKSSSVKLAGLIAPGNNPSRLNGRGNMLPSCSRKAIELLNENPKGFFLMIEGGEIDLTAQAKDALTFIDEILDFDQAVGEVLDFALNDGHTLVVITGDHETGGVAIIGGDVQSHKVKIKFSTEGHTAVMVPVYSFGPGAEKFGGIYDNTDLFQDFLKSFGFEKLK